MRTGGRLIKRIWDFPLGLGSGQKLALFALVLSSLLFAIANINELVLYYYSYEDFERFLFTGEVFQIYSLFSPFVWFLGSLLALWVYRRKKG